MRYQEAVKSLLNSVNAASEEEVDVNSLEFGKLRLDDDGRKAVCVLYVSKLVPFEFFDKRRLFKKADADLIIIRTMFHRGLDVQYIEQLSFSPDILLKKEDVFQNATKWYESSKFKDFTSLQQIRDSGANRVDRKAALRFLALDKYFKQKYAETNSGDQEEDIEALIQTRKEYLFTNLLCHYVKLEDSSFYKILDTRFNELFKHSYRGLAIDNYCFQDPKGFQHQIFTGTIKIFMRKSMQSAPDCEFYPFTVLCGSSGIGKTKLLTQSHNSFNLIYICLGTKYVLRECTDCSYIADYFLKLKSVDGFQLFYTSLYLNILNKCCGEGANGKFTSKFIYSLSTDVKGDLWKMVKKLSEFLSFIFASKVEVRNTATIREGLRDRLPFLKGLKDFEDGIVSQVASAEDVEKLMVASFNFLKKTLVKHGNDKILVIGVDEAGEMHKQDKNKRLYEVPIISRLFYYFKIAIAVQGIEMFHILVDKTYTNAIMPSVMELAARNIFVKDQLKMFPLFYLILPFRKWELDESNFDQDFLERITLHEHDRLVKDHPEELFCYSRPMFFNITTGGSNTLTGHWNSNLMSVIRDKLTDYEPIIGIGDPKEYDARLFKLALLAILLPIIPRDREEGAYLVSNKMAQIKIFDNETRSTATVHYHAEPILCEGALRMVFEKGLWEDLMETLFNYICCDNIDYGNENVEEFICAISMVKLVSDINIMFDKEKKKAVLKNDFFSTPVQVSDFLKQITGKSYKELAADVNNQSLLKACMSFVCCKKYSVPLNTTFPTGDKNTSQAILFEAYKRRIFIMCPAERDGVNMIIPIVVPKDNEETEATEQTMSGIFIQVKNSERNIYSNSDDDIFEEMELKARAMVPDLPLIVLLFEVGEEKGKAKKIIIQSRSDKKIAQSSDTEAKKGKKKREKKLEGGDDGIVRVSIKSLSSLKCLGASFIKKLYQINDIIPINTSIEIGYSQACELANPGGKLTAKDQYYIAQSQMAANLTSATLSYSQMKALADFIDETDKTFVKN